MASDVRQTAEAADACVARIDLQSVGRARELLDAPGVVALEIERPPLDETPYGGLVQALLRERPFKCDFNGQPPQDVFDMLSRELLGGAHADEARRLAEEVAQMQGFAEALGGGAPVVSSVRNYFAPGDLVWHVDRSHQKNAMRFVWPLGRPGGMRVTPQDNIDPVLFRAFMSREYPLLYELDRQIMGTPGATLEALWAHRPAQIAAMMSGEFPFIRNRAREVAIAPHFASVHRIDTPHHQGTYHRSSWENRHAPGVQVVLTAGEP